MLPVTANSFEGDHLAGEVSISGRAVRFFEGVHIDGPAATDFLLCLRTLVDPRAMTAGTTR